MAGIHGAIGRSVRFAEGGDLRLVGQSEVAHWQIGRLEVFFEGSWSQVCATGFGANDADVACRQLGFGSGTVASSLADLEPPSDVLVSPVVALTFSGCTGAESRLLDCPLEDAFRGDSDFSECFNNGSPGLQIACVANPGEPGGAVLLVRIFTRYLCALQTYAVIHSRAVCCETLLSGMSVWLILSTSRALGGPTVN